MLCWITSSGLQNLEGKDITGSSIESAELVRACALSGSDLAWRAFLLRFQKPIGLSVIRVAQRFGLRPQEFVDDLVQEVFTKLCEDKCTKLYQFSCDHPEAVDAYVKTIATNHAHDFFKARWSRKRGGGETAQLLDTVEVKAEASTPGGTAAIHREVLLGEIDHCLNTYLTGDSGTRDRSIFWMHHRLGMSAKAIASIPSMGLTVKGVESVLLRLIKLVTEKVAARWEQSSKERSEAKGFGSLESY